MYDSRHTISMWNIHLAVTQRSGLLAGDRLRECLSHPLQLFSLSLLLRILSAKQNQHLLSVYQFRQYLTLFTCHSRLEFFVPFCSMCINIEQSGPCVV